MLKEPVGDGFWLEVEQLRIDYLCENVESAIGTLKINLDQALKSARDAGMFFASIVAARNSTVSLPLAGIHR